MKRFIITTIVLLVATDSAGIKCSALAQDMGEGDLVYPFQYGDLDAYSPRPPAMHN